MFIQVNDFTIYYEIIGEGIPIFNLHGFYPDHRLMKGCIEPIFNDRQYKRIYFDIPGMGKTKKNTQINTAEEMFELLLNFKNKIIGDSKYIIIGESYGGYLLRKFIKQESSKILGALFICPCIEPISKDRVVPKRLILHREKNLQNNYGKKLFEEFESVAVVQNEDHIKRFESEIYSGLKCADSDYLEKYRESGYAFKKDVDNINEPFSNPTLFVAGKQDHFVGYQDAYKILKNYTRATFCILDEAGHDLQIEKNELFNTLVIDWLNRIERNKQNISKE